MDDKTLPVHQDADAQVAPLQQSELEGDDTQSVAKHVLPLSLQTIAAALIDHQPLPLAVHVHSDMLPTDPAQLRTMVLSLRQHVVAYQKHLQDVQLQLSSLTDSHDTVLKENKRLKDGAAKVSERSTALLDELKSQTELALARRERLQRWEAELRYCEDLI